VKRRNTETAIQRAVLDILRLCGVPDLFFCAIPNGGKRNLIEAVNLKRSGVVAGVPDLLLVADGRVSFLELKQPRGRLSPVQAAAHAQLRRAGARVETSYGLDHAVEVLKRWGLVRGVV
jgi:hypothetical protein